LKPLPSKEKSLLDGLATEVRLLKDEPENDEVENGAVGSQDLAP
jgi:hypothetical protein